MQRLTDNARRARALIERENAPLPPDCARVLEADLSRVLGINQTTVSHQLRLLKNLGIVKCERHGKIIFYSLVNDTVNDVMLKGVEFLGC